MSFFKNTGEKIYSGSKNAGEKILSKSKTTGSIFFQKSVTGGTKVFHGVAGYIEKVNPIPARRKEDVV
jgi:hypothetical protein